MLNGFEYQVYLNVHQVTDAADGHYRILCDFLNGRGCEDIETAWQELIYKDLYADLQAYAGKVIGPLFEAFGYEKIKDKAEAEVAENSDDNKKSAKSKTTSKKPAALTAKKVTDILASAKKEITAFVKTASKFAEKEKLSGLKLDAEKEYAEITARLKKLVAVHNLKKAKAPADLQKALLKAADATSFAGLMKKADDSLEVQLLCWALCGSLAEKGCALEFAFGRKFNEYLSEEKLLAKDQRANLTKLFILARATNTAVIKKDSKAAALEVTKLLMQGRWSYALSGANCFDNIWWFNKELSNDSLNKTILLLALAGKNADYEGIQKFYKLLAAAKTKAAYKCELMLKEFEPKDVVKKSAAKVVKKPASSKTSEKSSKVPAKRPTPKKTAKKTSK